LKKGSNGFPPWCSEIKEIELRLICGCRYWMTSRVLVPGVPHKAEIRAAEPILKSLTRQVVSILIKPKNMFVFSIPTIPKITPLPYFFYFENGTIC